MKSVKKGLSVNRIVGTIKRRTGTGAAAASSSSAPPTEPSAPQGLAISETLDEDSPEGIAVRNVKAFCESGGPNKQGDEVLFLPPIVDAAESSPTAATQCARYIRKYLTDKYSPKASWQYNAVMLIRILADNPGRSFTRNFDFKFCNVVKDVLRNGRDPSVRQILMETLDDFEQTRANDEGVKDLVYMWKKEKERAFQRGERNFRYPQGAHSAPQMSAGQYNQGGHSSNYFARSHSNNRLPSPVELASRLEEARSSAKLLSQVVVNTPPQELLNNDLVKEFADRCQSATRSIQLYMLAEDPAPDNDTMENLIDANEQLQSALNQHQRGVLNARKQLGLNSTSDRNQPPSLEMTNGQPPLPPIESRPQQQQQWQPSQPTSSSSTPAPQQPPRKAVGATKGKTTDTYAPPDGPPPGLPPKEQMFDFGGDPFKDPTPAPLRGAPPPPPPSELAHDPYKQPGFNPTQSYVGRQDSAVGHATMHGAGAGAPEQAQGARRTRDDDDIYDSR
ncbi:hypothetical protein ACHAQA_007628 [Verticillium albo-atrum]